MSPLASQTATTPVSPTLISAESAYITGAILASDMIAANDTEQAGKGSLLVRRRKRQNRRATH